MQVVANKLATVTIIYNIIVNIIIRKILDCQEGFCMECAMLVYSALKEIAGEHFSKKNVFYDKLHEAFDIVNKNN